MTKRLLSIIFFLAFNISVKAQKDCLTHVVYKTSHIGDGKSFLDIPLKFFFNGDTLKIAENEFAANSADNTPFFIKGRSCIWNKGRTEGESRYELEIVSGGKIRNPTLIIKVKGGRGVITLQYDDSETRVFQMVL